MKRTARQRAAVISSFRHSGLPLRAIAERHSVPVGTVLYWTSGETRVVQRNRRRDAKLTREEVAAAAKDYDAGKKYRQIAREYGVTAQAIYYAFHPHKRQKWNERPENRTPPQGVAAHGENESQEHV